jgi:hypothetical protein
MKDFVITINGVRYKAKKLDQNFAQFVEDTLEEVDVSTNKDNKIERIFYAYLNLAKKYYKCEREIENIIKDIEL